MSFLWTGFLLGLAGSFHCAAMCGPLMLGSGFASTKWTNVLIYHLSRIMSYLMIGFIFGLLGQSIALFFYQQTISVITGVILLIWGLSLVLPVKIFNSGVVFKIWRKITSGFYIKASKSNPAGRNIILGMLNGFLPCGMVYIAATASISMGNTGLSMAYLALFGLGTLPMMLGITLSGNMVGVNLKSGLKKLIPYVSIILAVLFIVRGLALDIPYLSPKMTIEKGHVENSCGHCVEK